MRSEIINSVIDKWLVVVVRWAIVECNMDIIRTERAVAADDYGVEEAPFASFNWGVVFRVAGLLSQSRYASDEQLLKEKERNE